MAMVPKEVQLRVADAKQRDVGHGKVRIDNETMQKLAITAGDFIEVHGKRTTVAIAWPAYAEDQGQEIVRMDGLLRRNAGVALNEYITIKKAEVKDAQTIVFAPTDVRLSVDEEFVGFVKRRFMDMPFMEGDMTLLSIFGSAVPLIATRTRPHGPVKITEYAEKGHVSLHKRHVHEPALDEAHELLVNAQPDISRSKDDRLGVLDLRLLDRDILVKRDARVSTQKPIHPDNLLTLVLGIRGPRDRNSRPFTVNLDKVPCRYGKLLHRLVVNADLAMTHVPLLSISYPQLYFL